MSSALTREEIIPSDGATKRSSDEGEEATFAAVIPPSLLRFFASPLASETASTSSFKCSGMVPQHPPTMFTPNSLTNRINPFTKSGGVIGNWLLPSTMIGSPAFGRQLTSRGQ